MKMLSGFMQGSRKFFAIGILASLLVTALDMLTPQIIRHTVDSVIGNKKLNLPDIVIKYIDELGGVVYFRDHLWVIGAAVVTLGLLIAVLKYVNVYFNALGAETLTKTMRDKLFVQIERLPAEWHSQNKTGDIIQRCTSDIETVKNFVADQLISIFRIVILLIVSFSVMFSMNKVLALIAFAAMPVVVLYSLIFRKKIEKRFSAVDEAEGVLSAVTQENLTGVRVVRAFGREDFERRKFDEKNNIFANLMIKLGNLFSLFWGIGDVISGAQVLLVLVFGTVFCVKGYMTSGDFIAFMTYNAMLMWPVRSLGRVISDMSKAGVAIDRVGYIMKSDKEIDDGKTQVDMHGDIEFENVTFSYFKNDIKVLNNVNFSIPGGSVVGIMGGTGSGKSTVVSLLERLYELQEGEIRIGGVPIREIPRSVLHSGIGSVLQEPYLFSKTIGENIAITSPGATEETIRDCATAACLDDAIMEFSEGYGTMVGERGVTLSGGQKQRCAIARMLMRNAPIMIFDDSLSAVDTETDIKIRAALRERFAGSTVIIISHRISTLMNADNILVFDDGRIAEQGNHAELVAKGGIYASVCAMQKGVADGGDENG